MIVTIVHPNDFFQYHLNTFIINHELIIGILYYYLVSLYHMRYLVYGDIHHFDNLLIKVF